MGRASTSSSVHDLKSSETATWTRFPLPLVPNAYHLLSAAFMKLGSGKLVLRPSQAPVARFSNRGELRAPGRRDRVSRAHVEVDLMKEDRILDD